MSESLASLRQKGGGGGNLSFNTISRKLLKNNASQSETLTSGKEYILTATLRIATDSDFRMVSVLIHSDRTYTEYGAVLANAYASMTLSGNSLSFSGTHPSIYTEFLLLEVD